MMLTTRKLVVLLKKTKMKMKPSWKSSPLQTKKTTTTTTMTSAEGTTMKTKTRSRRKMVQSLSCGEDGATGRT